MMLTCLGDVLDEEDIEYDRGVSGDRDSRMKDSGRCVHDVSLSFVIV